MLKSLKFLAISLFAACSMLAAAKMPLDTVTREGVPDWRWEVSEQGELKLSIGDVSYTLATRISYPHMKENAWNTIPDALAKVAQRDGKVTVDFQCAHYSLHREVEKNGHRLTVKDTYRNLAKEDVAIAFDNITTCSKKAPKDNVMLAGSLDTKQPHTPDTPAQNSSIFFADENAAMALVLEDDFYKLQASLKKRNGKAIVENRSFALAPGDSYTFEYSFYPTGKGDYWDFINRMRRDWDINSKVEGNLIFCTCPHPQLASTIPQELKTALTDYLGAKFVCGTNYTWLTPPSSWLVQNAAESYLGEYGSLEIQVGKLKSAVAHAAALSPDMAVIAKIQTIFGAPAHLVDQPVPMEDSVAIAPDGKPVSRPIRDKDKNIIGYNHIHYPMIGNTYYNYLLDKINQAMDAGCKIVYFDTFCYSFWSYYGRWTYGKWDGRTVDLDTKTWTIAKKKADMAVLASDAQLAFNDLIRKRGGKMFFNNTPCTRKQLSLLKTCGNFTEAGYAQLPFSQHASHPVNLGYTPGYQFRGENWKTPKDLYENVMGNLDYGCLTYVYWLVSQLPTSPTIYQRMYPITIKNIYAGCVEGEERIVTNRSGRYSFGNGMEPKIYIYDKNGIESEPTEQQMQSEDVDGKVVVTLTLPEGGAAVLVKQFDVRDCLMQELNF